ncbi:MAG: DNA polymerase III subunit alpha, partial [Actinomycetota bacterium]
MLDGASRVEQAVAAVASDGQPAIAITDHGNMYGAIPMYHAARAAGVKPIIGMEGYFTNTSRLERPKRSEHEMFHLTLLAESDAGYRNLMKLSSSAFLEGYYYKPRTDWELLERHAEGVIATSGCLGGLLPQLVLKGEERAALAAAGRFQEIFGRDGFFIELQDHGQDDDARVVRPLLDIARALRAPVVATNDSHYTHQHEAEAHDALLCVQTGSLQTDANRLRFEGDEFYIKRAVEMRHIFRELPEACDNTLLIAERANVEIEFGRSVLPSFPVPEGHTDDSYLRELTLAGARERYGAKLRPEVVERLDFELGVISSMGFPAYFLVVWDLVRYAKTRGIRVGPGRGSAAGSCVAYCLQIVDVDPIQYDLLFERMLNPGRQQMPDIDMD